MTERYHKTDPMSDLISDDYRMLQLISRFGITLGFGDKSVADTCRASGVDTATFLSVVNYIKDGAHSHVEERADEVSLPALMRYLKNSHGYFVDYRLPYIRRQLIEAVDYSAGGRIAFLILDAPAHQDHQGVVESLQASIESYAKYGIKIIPVFCSSPTKECEFMCRFFSTLTGGTYVFLTDDSGVGGDHIEASVGQYQVEALNDLLVRLIAKYIS